jgi:hypothetical protein
MSEIKFNLGPTDASRLNRTEIEIGALRAQYLDRRVVETTELESKIALWEKRGSANQEKVHCIFDREKSRQKKSTPARSSNHRRMRVF